MAHHNIKVKLSNIATLLGGSLQGEDIENTVSALQKIRKAAQYVLFLQNSILNMQKKVQHQHIL